MTTQLKTPKRAEMNTRMHWSVDISVKKEQLTVSRCIIVRPHRETTEMSAKCTL